MKKVFTIKSLLLLAVVMTTSSPLFSQSWSLTGNAGTSPGTNYLGTSDNTALLFKTNNQTRVTLSSGTYGGLTAGSPGQESFMNIFGKDVVGTTSPLFVSGSIAGLTWGNSNGQTLGRLIRLNQGGSGANGGVNFYDIGIGKDTCFFITNHSVPPSSGNGVIRKRMIVISPQDRVGINLQGDVIGTGAVPTANFHTNGTVRFQNLPYGYGDLLRIDVNGNITRESPARMGNTVTDSLQAEVSELKKEVAELRSLINSVKGGAVEITKADGKQLYQNAPNPFNESTVIKYTIPAGARKALLSITDSQGRIVKAIDLSGQKEQSVVIKGGELVAGTYFYSLIIDGNKTDTKRMVLTR